MLLPFYKAVCPAYRHPKKVIPKPPRLQIFTSKPSTESPQPSFSSRPSLPRDSLGNVELPRRATHPSNVSRRDTCRSPPILSTSQTPGGGNPSSVSSWFGSWIRKGGPLAASNPGTTLGESCSPLSPRTGDFTSDTRRESDGDILPPELDITKDATGEFVDVKLSTSFRIGRRRSSGTFPDDYDLKRRGSMTLNNVSFTEDTFRVTGFHGGQYHVDYHLQSMERTDDIDTQVFRVLREDILYFFTPPIHALPLSLAPSRSPEIPCFGQGQRKVTCIIADLDALDLRKLTVRIEDEDQQECEPLTPKDDRQWRQVQDFAMRNTSGIDELVKQVLS